MLGPNVKAIVISSGGSAALKPSFFVSPCEGNVGALKEAGTEVVYSEGARGLLFDTSIKR